MELNNLSGFALHGITGEPHDTGPAHGIFSCNGGQRHTAAAVVNDGVTVHVERYPPQPEAFEPPASHALADALTNQVTLNSADAPNQGQKEPPRRLGRVPLNVDHQALVRDRLSGMSLTQVSKKFGVSRASVVRFTRAAMKGEPAQVGWFQPTAVQAPVECMA